MSLIGNQKTNPLETGSVGCTMFCVDYCVIHMCRLCVDEKQFSSRIEIHKGDPNRNSLLTLECDFISDSE